MAAFFIAQYQVNDADLYATYSAGAGPVQPARRRDGEAVKGPPE